MTLQKDSHTPKKSKLPLYISLSLIIVLVVSYFTIPAINSFLDEAWNVLTSNDEARIKNWVEDFGWFGPVVIILAMVAQMFLLVIPTILLMIVTILAYGPFWGSVIILISVYIASSVGYVIGKYLGSGFISRLLGEKTLKKVSSFLEDYGFWAVVITRINPFLSNDAISFVAGILKMNYLKFIGATMLGIAPLIFLIAIIGENTDSLKNGLLWGSLGSLLIFGGYIWWDKKRKSKKLR
ncbi:TVP38/TMEM64 family protein [Gelidibacter sp. F63206]|uniref:TVP38/TMEM64 family protein n=1 Tax=Gelidibacter sp. F63206 TaxID=2926425 RepID=UPI001FF27187|nr:TVP38/TMEM64 family protein [Gelidibacter sp. F63206]MCK0115233.1 TVP38/TMEM64 family protein [Gelidibacter sp. F63206]